jgi:predicted nucleic acid-binding Zn ribbon protein
MIPARGDRWRCPKLEPLGGTVLAALPEAVRRNLLGWRGVVGWAEAVGPEVARRSRAVAYHDGRLTVQVSGSVWMHHLMALKAQLVEQVNRATGARSPVIRDIIFVVEPSLAGPPRTPPS